MEHSPAADVQNRDGLLSAEKKRAEPGCRRQQLRGRSTGLLDLPLGVKIPLEPGSSVVFHRTKLGETLHRPSGYFNLGDPYCHLLGNEYNSLHDPHLREYYNRKDNLRRLRRGGYITKDDKVVCTLREFNEYRQYLTTLKIELDKMYGPEKVPKPQGSQKCSKEEQHNEVHTTLSRTTLTKVQELAESAVKEVLERVKRLEQSVRVLKRAPLAISRRLFGSARRAEAPSAAPPPDLHQEIGLVSREIAATLLDHLGKRGACSTAEATEPRLSARRRQQHVAAGATQAGRWAESRARQAEFPRYDGAASQPSLDQITKDAVESVAATLQSFVASQFEQRYHCRFPDILKLPIESISTRQPQPPSSSRVMKEGRSSRARLLVLQPTQNAAELSRESSTLAGESIPNAISKVQQLHAELEVHAETIVHNALATLRKEAARERHAKARGLQGSSEETPLESGLVEQHGQPRTAVALGANCGRREAEERGQRDGNGSNLGQDTLRPEGKKSAAGKLDESPPRTKLPPVIIPGMAMLSEDKEDSEESVEELSPRLLPSVLQSSEQDAQSTPEGGQKPLCYPSAPASRPCTAVLEPQPNPRPGSMRDTFPSTGQQYSRQPVPPAAPKPPSQRGAWRRPVRVKPVTGPLQQWEC